MKKVEKNILKGVIYLIIPIIIELLFSKKVILEKSTLIRLAMLYGIEILYFCYFIINKYKEKIKKGINFVINKRYIIIPIIFVVCILFKINLSSINIWNNFLNENNFTKNILGNAREIRADEWLVQSPTMLAQTLNKDGYKMYNSHLMQGHCNVMMTGGPILNVTTIAKPLTWGFLLFGTEYGFSWWWMLRILLLLIVSFEIARIITKKDNVLSIAGMLVLAIAPGIMWWFSTAIVDSYIWGMAIVVLFHTYMENLETKDWKKLLIALGMIISIPAFAFALYPAYQVPLAYVIVIFMINDLVKHFKELKKKDYFIMAGTLIISLGILAYFIIFAWTDIQTMMGTVYPGSRFETGGDYTINQFIAGYTNIFLPYDKEISNPCEISTYIYSIVGLIALILYYINNFKKEKIKDSNKILEIGLMALYAFFFVWLYIGFNKILAQITFLYYSPTARTQLIFGMIGVLLTLMLMKKFENVKILSKKASITGALISSMVLYVVLKNSAYSGFFTTVKLELITVITFFMVYSILQTNKKAFAYIMCIVSIIAGATINPINRGVDIIYKTDLAQEIQKIEKEDEEALWIGRYNWSGQYLLANGANTLNGVNSYPNFQWLNIVDPDKIYNDVYNRYAHIGIILAEKTEFRLLTTDSYEVDLTYQNLKDLGIKYYLTDVEYSESEKNQFHLTVKYENTEKGQYIYQVN
ncbi:MAG: hypothetical protein ACLR1U_01475 [Clostridia bacterium]